MSQSQATYTTASPVAIEIGGLALELSTLLRQMEELEERLTTPVSSGITTNARYAVKEAERLLDQAQRETATDPATASATLAQAYRVLALEMRTGVHARVKVAPATERALWSPIVEALDNLYDRMEA